MSNFIHGSIICFSLKQIPYSTIKNELIMYCKSNEFSIQFSEVVIKKEETIIKFQLSDNDSIKYCENFMEPIFYDTEGKPVLEGLLKDIEKLKGMVRNIFSFESVKRLELRFSFVEVDEEEYTIHKTSINDMERIILNQYLHSINVPTIEILIGKTED